MANICNITHFTLASFTRNQIPFSSLSNANKGEWKKCAQVDCVVVYMCVLIYTKPHMHIYTTHATNAHAAHIYKSFYKEVNL